MLKRTLAVTVVVFLWAVALPSSLFRAVNGLDVDFDTAAAVRKETPGTLLQQLSDNIAALSTTIQNFESTEGSGGAATRTANSKNVSGCDFCPEQKTSIDMNGMKDLWMQALPKSSRTTGQNPVFAPSLRQLLRLQTLLGRRSFRRIASPPPLELIDALKRAASHFSAIALQARSGILATTTATGTGTTDVVYVLEDVSTLSAALINGTAHVLANAAANRKMTVGVATTSLVAVWTFLERVTMATTSLVVHSVAKMANGTSSSRQDVSQTRDDLRRALGNDNDNVLEPVIKLLVAAKDMSGLATTLGDLMVPMSKLEMSVTRLFKNDGATGTKLVDDKGLAGVLHLTNGLTKTVLNTITSMALGVSNRSSLATMGSRRKRTSPILLPALGLLSQSLGTTLNAIVSTFDSMVGILQIDLNRKQSASKSIATKNGNTEASSTSVSGDTLLYLLCSINSQLDPSISFSSCETIGLIPVAILLSPLWLPILYIFIAAAYICEGINNNGSRLFCSIFQTKSRGAQAQATITDALQCQVEALSCENRALAQTLPSL